MTMMKRNIIGAPYTKVAQLIYDTPLMVTPQRLRVVLDALSDKLGLVDLGEVNEEVALELSPYAEPMADSGALFKALVAEQEGDQGAARLRGYALLKNGAALIPVSGTLVNRASWLDAMSGLTSYERIRSAFNAAMNDTAVKRVVLEIDSPGGSAQGVFDLADLIYKARRKKPVTAIVNDLAASAAYMLASAADEVWATRTSMVGSIGVIATHFDYSGMTKQMGVKVTHVFAGARKADLSPYFPLNEKAQDWLQKMVDDTYKTFVAGVARNRGVSSATIRGQEAAVFMGNEAVDQNLVDRVMTIDEAADRIVGGRLSQSASRGSAGLSSSTVLHGGEKVEKIDVQGIYSRYNKAMAGPETIQ